MRNAAALSSSAVMIACVGFVIYALTTIHRGGDPTIHARSPRQLYKFLSRANRNRALPDDCKYSFRMGKDGRRLLVEITDQHGHHQSVILQDVQLAKNQRLASNPLIKYDRAFAVGKNVQRRVAATESSGTRTPALDMAIVEGEVKRLAIASRDHTVRCGTDGDELLTY